MAAAGAGRPPTARLEDLDAPGRAVHAYPVAGRDPLRRDRRADHGRDTEFARQHGRMRGQAAGVGDQPGDLGEQHDPGRVGHLADQDVALADLVELVDGADHPGDALDDARRAAEPVTARSSSAALVEPLGEAPVDEVREVELGLRRGADPVARVDLGRLPLALAAPRRAPRASIAAALADERRAARCSGGTCTSSGWSSRPASTSLRPMAMSTSRTCALAPWSM